MYVFSQKIVINLERWFIVSARKIK